MRRADVSSGTVTRAEGGGGDAPLTPAQEITQAVGCLGVCGQGWEKLRPVMLVDGEISAFLGRLRSTGFRLLRERQAQILRLSTANGVSPQDQLQKLLRQLGLDSCQDFPVAVPSIGKSRGCVQSAWIVLVEAKPVNSGMRAQTGMLVHDAAVEELKAQVRVNGSFVSRRSEEKPMQDQIAFWYVREPHFDVSHRWGGGRR